ncbi:DUF2267 domain-containing protein [Actinomycetospora lutea]|uniref:DUF2267 domain-containing protein n=1 Tax=Actinomycetospora lutea TaxID=663604 RepID=UPI0023670040|nr:DUF2267 domain-containing protein [Actinomycetospora lutea]MDD7942436.1 DUF2267 domain-containing protein [Actinomycetospora lutea]
MAQPIDPLGHAQDTAHQWLNLIADRLGTTDRQFTYRVLRVWLHLVRDRLRVDAAAHLAAQLPAVLRGVFYEGWVPSRVPVRFDAAWFTEAFARDAGVSPADVPALAATVFEGLDSLFSPGQLDHVLAAMPADLRRELEGRRCTDDVRTSAPPGSSDRARLTALENSVETLAEALRVLVRGLEELPTEEPEQDRPAKAAQEAHRLLLSRPGAQQASPGTT